jgi:hypothetical protein
MIPGPCQLVLSLIEQLRASVANLRADKARRKFTPFHGEPIRLSSDDLPLNRLRRPVLPAQRLDLNLNVGKQLHRQRGHDKCSADTDISKLPWRSDASGSPQVDSPVNLFA